MSSSKETEEELFITLVNPTSGQSESLSFPSLTSIQQVAEFAGALLDMSSSLSSSSSTLQLFKDGQRLNAQQTLQGCHIQSGDVLVVTPLQQQHQQQTRSQRQTRSQQQTQEPPASAAVMGGLDFSSLLGGGGGGGSMQSSNMAVAASSSSQQRPSSSQQQRPSQSEERRRPPVYFPGMSVEDAMSYNPHPDNFITVLQSHESLFKQLRHHQPKLAQQLQNQTHDVAVQIWRNEMVKGGIASAIKKTQHYHKERDMKLRLQTNPKDETAKAYFDNQTRQAKVDEQYMQMMEEYPEAMGRVLMLYVEAKINGHAIQAFCDTGAQMTIMSNRVAQTCGLSDLIDTRFAGVAAGVGTGKILGRIHMVQLQLGNAYFPCSVSVMDDPVSGATEMPFLLGLDMMKRHLVQIDLQLGIMQFNTTTPPQEISFLHEKDLDISQGGTKGFDANKANQELMTRMELESTNDDDNDKDKKKAKTTTNKSDSSSGGGGGGGGGSST